MNEIPLIKLKEDELKISEIFSSIEGEGIKAGYIATFIRLIGCNLRCSYCDSMYAVEPKGNDYKILTIEQIVNTCTAIGNNKITLTGGEPLLNKEKSMLLIDKLLDEGFSINIETNGAIDLHDYYKRYLYDDVLFTIDYKSKSSGQSDFNIMSNYIPIISDYIKMDYVQLDIREKIVIKFVVGSYQDLNDMLRFLTSNSMRYSSEYKGIFVSPVFGKIEPETIVKYLKKHKIESVRLQLQLHKFIWEPTERGV